MIAAAAFLLLLGQPQAEAPPEPAQGVDHDGEYGWICSVGIEVEGYRGGILRHYPSGATAEPYRVDLEWRRGERRYGATWTIDPRPEGPPPQRAGRRRHFQPRAESEAFVLGPDYVHIDFGWLVPGVVGPVHAHYWGDGVSAGADLIYTARQVRRRTDRAGMLAGFSGGLSEPALLQALAPARLWSVVVSDSTGKVLLSDSFEVPRRELVAAEFRRARAILDDLEARFRVDHRPLREGSAACQDNEDPNATI
jgi:hypothetical protein